MDENTDNERIMDIVAGSNNVPTYTEEERSQTDGFLDISTAEDQDTTAEDQNTAAEDQDTAAEDGDYNEDLDEMDRDDNAAGSNEVVTIMH